MPDYLSNDPSIAKGVEQSIAKDVDTFWPVVVGVHDVVRFVSLPSKTALGPWFVGSGRSFLQTFTCKGAYRELEDLPENVWQGCAFEQPLRTTDFSPLYRIFSCHFQTYFRWEKSCNSHRRIDLESHIGARPPSLITSSVRANCWFVTKARNCCNPYLMLCQTQKHMIMWLNLLMHYNSKMVSLWSRLHVQ